MSWNYRVRRFIDHWDRPTFGIIEVYYGTDGETPERWSGEDRMSPHGETLEELKADLRYMTEALDKPVLEEKGAKLVEVPWEHVENNARWEGEGGAGG